MFRDQSSHGGGTGPRYASRQREKAAIKKGILHPNAISIQRRRDAARPRQEELKLIIAAKKRKKAEKYVKQSKQGIYMKTEPGFKPPKRGAAATLAGLQQSRQEFITGLARVAVKYSKNIPKSGVIRYRKKTIRKGTKKK